MDSISRQCSRVNALLEQLQGCVDRQGHVIPAREKDFAVCVARAREEMGIRGGARSQRAAEDLYCASGSNSAKPLNTQARRAYV